MAGEDTRTTAMDWVWGLGSASAMVCPPAMDTATVDTVGMAMVDTAADTVGYGGYGYGYPGLTAVMDTTRTMAPVQDMHRTTAPMLPILHPTPAPPATPASPMSAPASIANPKPEPGTLASVKEFAEKGEAAFKAGNYQGAVYAWRHAVVDDPQNGLLTMMLGQALFATGKFEEAAGATQAAMHHLPKEQWGVVVGHYTELYGKTHDYTEQLRALEKAMKAKSDDPALRFLTGFQYAYLGFADQAIDQLNHAVKLAPHDEMAKQLRDSLRAKLTKPAAIPPLPGIQSGPALKATPRESDDE